MDTFFWYFIWYTIWGIFIYFLQNNSAGWIRLLNNLFQLYVKIWKCLKLLKCGLHLVHRNWKTLVKWMTLIRPRLQLFFLSNSLKPVVCLSVRPFVRSSFCPAKSPLGPKGPSPLQELERRGAELSSIYIYIYPQTCPRQVQDLSQTSPRYGRHIFEIAKKVMSN